MAFATCVFPRREKAATAGSDALFIAPRILPAVPPLALVTPANFIHQRVIDDDFDTIQDYINDSGRANKRDT